MLGLVRTRLVPMIARRLSGRMPSALTQQQQRQRRMYSTSEPTQSATTATTTAATTTKAKGGFLKGASKVFLFTSSVGVGAILFYAHNPTIAAKADELLPLQVVELLQSAAAVVKTYIHTSPFAPKIQSSEISEPRLEAKDSEPQEIQQEIQQDIQQEIQQEIQQDFQPQQANESSSQDVASAEDSGHQESETQTLAEVNISTETIEEAIAENLTGVTENQEHALPTLQEITADDPLRDADELSMVGNILGQEIVVTDEAAKTSASAEETNVATSAVEQEQSNVVEGEQQASPETPIVVEDQEKPQAEIEFVTIKADELQSHVQSLVQGKLGEVAKELEQQYVEQLREQHKLAQEAQQQRDLKWKSFVIDKLQTQEDQLNRLWQTRLEHEIQRVRDRFSAEFDDRRTKVQAIEERVLHLGQLFEKRISFAQDMTRIHALWVALFSLRHALHEELATPFHHELQILESASESSKEHDPVVKLAMESLLPLSSGVASVSSLQSSYKSMRNDVFRYAIHPDAEANKPDTIVYGTGGVLAHFASYIAASLLIKPNLDDVAATISDQTPADLHPHQRLARAEYYLLHEGDLHHAVQEFEMLPRLVRERMGPWLAEAQKRLVADQGYVLLQAHVSSLALSLL